MLDFVAIRRETDLRQLFMSYGIRVERNGLCLCPFHYDKRPSLKLYEEHYHCYSCQAHGDALSFVAHMENCSLTEAAKKLGYGALSQKEAGDLHRRRQLARQREQGRQSLQARAEAGILGKIQSFYKAMAEHPPKEDSPELHPDWLEAVHKLPLYEYLYEQLTGSDPIERAAAYHHKEVQEFVR